MNGIILNVREIPTSTPLIHLISHKSLFFWLIRYLLKKLHNTPLIIKFDFGCETMLDELEITHTHTHLEEFSRYSVVFFSPQILNVSSNLWVDGTTPFAIPISDHPKLASILE